MASTCFVELVNEQDREDLIVYIECIVGISVHRKCLHREAQRTPRAINSTARQSQLLSTALPSSQLWPTEAPTVIASVTFHSE